MGTLEALVGGPNRLGLRLLHSVRGIVRISLRHRAHIKTPFLTLKCLLVLQFSIIDLIPRL